MVGRSGNPYPWGHVVCGMGIIIGENDSAFMGWVAGVVKRRAGGSQPLTSGENSLPDIVGSNPTPNP